MNIVSLKEYPELLEQSLTYCKEKWAAVHDSFRKSAEESITAISLPQTWLLLGGENSEEILGFYQLQAADDLTVHTELTPFLTTLFVDPMRRGADLGCGEMLLTHARYEAARLGHEKLYVCTDHIGYYEKYGFLEIGLDIFSWGRACKIYKCDTPAEIVFKMFDDRHPKTDDIHLALARARWNRNDENPAVLLHHLKHFSYPESHNGRWYQIIAFKEHKVIGAVNFMQDSSNAQRWYLGDLFVVPEYRRRKVANRLITLGLDKIRSTMSGGEHVHSYIEKENTASQRLHRALGFTDLGTLLPFEALAFSESDTTWEINL